MKLYPYMIQKHLDEELPFMATENILMYCVRHKGGNRQKLHEAIRLHSVKAAEQVKVYGNENDLLDRIRSDSNFNLTLEELEKLMNPVKFTGMAGYQCEKFIEEIVEPLLKENEQCKTIDWKIKV